MTGRRVSNSCPARARRTPCGFRFRTPALDLGAQFARGRQIAMAACGECHTTALAGEVPPQPHHPPDLSIVASYERADFLKFMHTGKAAGNRELRMMSDVGARTDQSSERSRFECAL